jgi:predicted small lipoprotein YifL
MKIKSIFCLVLIALFAFTACGKKGPLEHLKDEKRPKFDKVSDEM